MFISILVSPKKGMMETFLWFPALHCWSSEMRRCIIYNFLGFLNAMSIFLCFLNSRKNKNNFNVYFSETVFLNSICCLHFCCCVSVLWHPHTFGAGWCVQYWVYFFCLKQTQGAAAQTLVAAKVFGDLKTGAKCIWAREEWTLKSTNTQVKNSGNRMSIKVWRRHN